MGKEKNIFDCTSIAGSLPLSTPAPNAATDQKIVSNIQPRSGGLNGGGAGSPKLRDPSHPPVLATLLLFVASP